MYCTKMDEAPYLMTSFDSMLSISVLSRDVMHLERPGSEHTMLLELDMPADPGNRDTSPSRKTNSDRFPSG